MPARHRGISRKEGRRFRSLDHDVYSLDRDASPDFSQRDIHAAVLMIIQTIKAWLDKLFAWWPWKRSSTVAYPEPTSNMSKSIAQEQVWRSVIEAPMPQPDISSVAVEHGVAENMPEPQPLLSDELSERLSPPAKHDEPPTLSHTLPSVIGKDMTILPDDVLMPSSRPEQQLEFLRYLVQQGVINEGFVEGQIPAQYQSKQEE
jgi:hypothetical protein